MTVTMLQEMLVVETVTAVLLAYASIWLLRKLHRAEERNRLLVERTAELQNQTAQSREMQSSAGEHLEAHQNWYHELFGNLNDIVLVHGLTENNEPTPFTDVSGAACRLLGYPRETLLARTIHHIQFAEVSVMAPFMTEAQMEEQRLKLAGKVVSKVIAKVLAGGAATYEDFFRTRDGKPVPVAIRVHRCDLLGKPMILWVARDLTETREGERAVKESQRQLQDFFAYSPLGIAMFDPNRQLIVVNRACLRMLGLPDQREFERFNLFDNPFLPPNAKQTLSKGQSVTSEIVVDFEEVRKKGLFASARTGRGHYEVLINNLGCDNNYRPRGYFAQFEDLTQRRKVEADLRRLQTADTSRDMAGGISGALEDVSFTDLVQILCAGGRCMELNMTSGNSKAKMFIHEGNVVDCILDDKRGEDAFYDLMHWRTGKFTAQPCKSPPSRVIQASAVSLLMEGARRFDDGQAAEQ